METPRMHTGYEDTEYVELKQKIVAAELLQKTPLYYSVLFLICLTLIGFIGLLLTQSESLFAVIILAIALVFPRVWLGYIGHDINHGQVFSSRRTAEAAGTIVWSLLSGVSMRFWRDKHNQHHIHTNKIGKDPDMDIFVFTSEKQRQFKARFSQVLARTARYQHIYFFIFMPTVYMSFVLKGIPHLLTQPRTGEKYLELLLMVIHFMLFFSFVFGTLGMLAGAIFSIVHFLAMGLLLGLVFTPNHVGCPVLGPDEEVTFRSQILTTRNITPSPFVDFFYGGLNYQVEHHLFPTMSRLRLAKAHTIVKEFCLSRGLPYHETTPLGSIREIYYSLKAYAEKC